MNVSTRLVVRASLFVPYFGRNLIIVSNFFDGWLKWVAIMRGVATVRQGVRPVCDRATPADPARS